jgi:aryl-alcohol dehydrogenase (NADP+)
MGGFLTGKYLKNMSPPERSRADYNQRYWERVNKEENYAALQELKSISEVVEVPLFKLVIAWILRNPLVTAPIIGASSPEQIEENIQITEDVVPDKIYKKLDVLK